MNYIELQELACAMLGWDCDEVFDSGREDEIEVALADKFGISYEQLGDIVKALLPLTSPLQSEMTGKYYHVFGKPDGVDKLTAIIKIPFVEKGGEHED